MLRLSSARNGGLRWCRGGGGRAGGRYLRAMCTAEERCVRENGDSEFGVGRGGGEGVGAKRRSWESRAARRAFLEEVAESFGVKEEEDWKKVTTKDLAAIKGSAGVLRFYGGSLYSALVDLFPEREWDATKCRPKLPKSYWESTERRRRFMDSIAKEFNVRSTEDWQRVSRREVGERGGYRLLALYSGSLSKLLSDVYPERDMDALVCREKAPNGHWSDDSNCRRALERLAKEKGVEGPWELSRSCVLENGLASLLNRFAGSYQRALCAFYPERLEEIEKSGVRKRRKPLNVAERGYWDSMEARRAFLDKVAEEHGVNEPADWREVTTGDITAMGGNGLLKKYGNSIYRALVDVYGEETVEEGQWDILHCRKRVPSTFWDERENIERFLLLAKEKLSIRYDEDWYRVSHEEIRELAGGGLLRRMSLVDALRLVWPKKSWQRGSLMQQAAKRSSQRQLFVAVTGLFPSPRNAAAASNQ